jgi:hypothetical protein
MSGLHKRVGELEKRDKAITIDVIPALQDLLYAEWHKKRPHKVSVRDG